MRNFLYRIADYFRENRGKMLKALVAAAVALFVVGTIYNVAERIQRARFDRQVNTLELQRQQAEARAQEREREAEALKVALEAKYAQLTAIRQRAETAETNLRNARRTVAPLKEAYEEIRNNPVDVPADTTCADACRELAGLGYQCK